MPEVVPSEGSVASASLAFMTKGKIIFLHLKAYSLLPFSSQVHYQFYSQEEPNFLFRWAYVYSS